MLQEERSERSRTVILDAALELFSHRGYGATSIRDIAGAAAVSTGSVYHHFKDKEAIFQTLLDQFWAATEEKDFPMNRAIEQGAFPDDLAALGEAAREIITNWRRHVTLIYVDVVEFEGRHIHRFYSDLSHRFARIFEERGDAPRLAARLRPGIPPEAALMMTMRVFIYYFVVEQLWGVPNHYGMSSDEATRIITDVLKHGMLVRDA
ncbi:MAG: helix-turn-helix domain-containing protein [Vicinamibacterales bacterium]|nr:helix-turn-helix domain-containing protein [Vicinamibacterales bacterium]